MTTRLVGREENAIPRLYCRVTTSQLELDGGGYFDFLLFEAGLVGLDYG
jgi:hypothetical protein